MEGEGEGESMAWESSWGGAMEERKRTCESGGGGGCYFVLRLSKRCDVEGMLNGETAAMVELCCWLSAWEEWGAGKC